MPHVLVADDDPRHAEVVRRYLGADGFDVVVVHDGPSALDQARRLRPDLVILDVMMPGLDGLQVCRTLRQESDVLILMLTARATEDDLLVGLEIGADDYLTKPFSPRELAARVRTVLRRASGATPAAETFTVGGARVDLTSRRAWAGDAEISLTSTEFDLLTHLLRHPGQVLSRDQLLSAVWGYAAAAGTRTVDVHVAQLRAKLGASSPIRTVRGIGYAADPA